MVTAVQVVDDYVLIADARDRCIRRYDREGAFLNSIGKDNRMKGFKIPNGALDFSVKGMFTLLRKQAPVPRSWTVPAIFWPLLPPLYSIRTARTWMWRLILVVVCLWPTRFSCGSMSLWLRMEAPLRE
jgi:hypothetical protein